MKATIDADTCIICELCVQTCQDVFKSEGDKVVVYVATVPLGSEDSCKKAAEECPVNAIKIK